MTCNFACDKTSTYRNTFVIYEARAEQTVARSHDRPVSGEVLIGDIMKPREMQDATANAPKYKHKLRGMWPHNTTTQKALRNDLSHLKISSSCYGYFTNDTHPLFSIGNIINRLGSRPYISLPMVALDINEEVELDLWISRTFTRCRIIFES